MNLVDSIDRFYKGNCIYLESSKDNSNALGTLHSLLEMLEGISLQHLSMSLHDKVKEAMQQMGNNSLKDIYKGHPAQTSLRGPLNNNKSHPCKADKLYSPNLKEKGYILWQNNSWALKIQWDSNFQGDKQLVEPLRTRNNSQLNSNHILLTKLLQGRKYTYPEDKSQAVILLDCNNNLKDRRKLLFCWKGLVNRLQRDKCTRHYKGQWLFQQGRTV